ncbi:MAG: hydroxyacid-oxoacid transhydrogenase [Rhodospirillales bacterium]
MAAANDDLNAPDGDTIFTVTAAAMKFGVGALAELGADARSLGMRRVVLFTDTNVAATEAVGVARAALAGAGLDAVVYDGCHAEPTDRTIAEATRFCRDGDFDGYVSLGGGSVMDTAKAANLLTTYPDDPLAYVNAPIGGAKPVPGPIKPHIACPTTCGTGSETTGIIIFDLSRAGVKTGISSNLLKPRMAVVDPTTTDSLPAGVIASTGFDVLTHAIESYTARPFTARARPTHPNERPPYQGATPYSDIGSLAAIRIGGACLVRAARDPDDAEARHRLMFAATLAGLAFGSAGVHIPHAMSYPVSQFNHDYTARGYENADPMVPHGISVVINAPAAFRFTARADPERHLRAAEALGADVSRLDPADAGDVLAATLVAMMRATDLPSGLAAIGYGEADIPRLAASAFAQKRPLAQASIAVTEADLAAIYRAAMRYW